MKRNRIFRILAVTVALLLMLVLPATPALAAPAMDVYPSNGPVGGGVTIYISGFTAIQHINITYDGAFQTQLISTAGTTFTTLTIPTSTAGYHTIAAANLDTPSENAVYYFIVTPDITMDKSSGKIGEVVTVNGTGFGASKNITIYYDAEAVATSVTNSVGSFTGATFLVPESFGGNHTVRAQDTNNNFDTANFIPDEEIAITPTSGTVASEVTVSGTAFSPNDIISITFDGTAVTTTPSPITSNTKGSFSATFNVPASASGTHTVAASDGTNEDSQTYTTAGSASISPDSGNVGDPVTVSGSGYVASQPVTITFDGTSVATTTSNSQGNFTATFDVPVRTAGTFTVVASDGNNIKELSFSITTSAEIRPETSASSPGHVGSEVTISGIGFIAGRTLTITYDSTQVATTTVLPDGRFSVTFDAPASSGGAHTIVATDQTTPKQFSFVMESAAPDTPQPLKPEMGIKAKAEAFFDWEDVTDPSGVTYTLQIATSSDFSASSIVLEKTGLTQSEYTLTKAERLDSVNRDNPYHWHIRAVDGAANASSWTGTGEFYVGFSVNMAPALIYSLLGAGAVLLGIFGFWLGRKTAYY